MQSNNRENIDTHMIATDDHDATIIKKGGWRIHSIRVFPIFKLNQPSIGLQ